VKRSGVAGCLTIIRQDLDVAMVLCGQRDNRAVEAMS
jgi:isopentenyl diphosphate isomerase/L-lactate dehydrogenase-like FMN-dependent dehydrogenase